MITLQQMPWSKKLIVPLNQKPYILLLNLKILVITALKFPSTKEQALKKKIRAKKHMFKILLSVDIQ